MTNRTPSLSLPLSNVMAFEALVDRVRARSENLPGMACFYGPSGYGKTRSAVGGANKSSAFYVEMDDSFTRKTLCQHILREIGLGEPKSAGLAELLSMIIDRLSETGDRPLVIDEADFLVRKGMIDIVRAIHDKSRAPVILIGEEMLPTKLKSFERAHNRMLDWVAATPCSDEDAKLIAETLARSIEIDPKLLAKIISISDGRVRRVMVNLEQVIAYARNAGKRRMTVSDWEGRTFFTGEPPKRRVA